MKQKRSFFIALLSFVIFLSSSLVSADKPHVKFCVDPDWYPYEKLTPTGEYIGIAADLIALIAKNADITYSIIRTKDWKESIEFSKKGICNALAFLNQTPQRDEWLIFSEPYFTDPNVIITKEDHDYVTNLKELSNESIALPEGSSIYEKVAKDFPNLTIIPVKSEIEAFSYVSQGLANLTLRSLTMAVYTIKQRGWFNLKVAGEVSQYTNRLRIGIIKEKPELKELLNQGISKLSPQEVRQITNNHVAIKVESMSDYKSFFKFFVGLLVIFGLIGIWIAYQKKINNKLSKLTKKLKEEIEKQAATELSLRLINQRYESLIEGSQEGIVVTQKYKIVFANPYFLELTGYNEEDLKHKNIDSYLYEEDRELAMDNHLKRITNNNPDRRYTARFLKKDGDILWCEISGTTIEWDGEVATLNFIVDISERIKAEEKILHMAHYDALTGLANRWLMDDRLEQQIALSTREQSKFSLLFVDLNKFKPINDTYGHEAGDLVLQTVAKRLKAILRESDTISRIGGDEYVILLPHATTLQSANIVIEKITHLFDEPFLISNQEFNLTCSIGMALFPDDGETKDALYTAADKSMYKDKNSR